MVTQSNLKEQLLYTHIYHQIHRYYQKYYLILELLCLYYCQRMSLLS